MNDNTTIKKLPTVILRQVAPEPLFNNPGEDWGIMKDVPLGEGEIILQLVAFLKEGESSVPGETMLERAEEMENFVGQHHVRRPLAGQSHAERLLDQTRSIPKEWREFVLIFAGTVWCSPWGDRLEVPSLYWDGAKWILRFCWLDKDFRSRYRLVRFREVLP